MRSLLIGVCALLLAAFSPGAAALAGPPMKKPAPTGKREPKLTKKDRKFVDELITNKLAEAEFSRIAATQASEAAVKKYADEFGKAAASSSNELGRLVTREGGMVPRTVLAKDRAVIERMQKIKGGEFDHQYLSQIVKYERNDVKVLQLESKKGQNKEFKDWAASVLPRAQRHLQVAENMTSSMKAHPMKGHY